MFLLFSANCFSYHQPDFTVSEQNYNSETPTFPWWLVLQSTYHSRNVKSAGSYISTQQDALLRLAEVKEGSGSFLLLLLSMDIKAIHLNISEKFWMKFDWITWGEEDHHFLWQIPLQEGIQKDKSLGTGHHTIALLQAFVGDLKMISILLV